MIEITYIAETLTCTRCEAILRYNNKPAWYCARGRKKKSGKLFCPTCVDINASEANKGNNKITGRPKGSKTCESRRMNHGRVGQGKLLNSVLTFEMRMKGIAHRNGYETYEEYRADLPDKKVYRMDVLRITGQQPLTTLGHYEKRAVNGKEGGYTLDHKISIAKGFKEGIPAEIIGDISNLQMLPREDNINKGWKHEHSRK